MPVFVMPIGERPSAPKTFECLDAFTRGYVVAMFWTECNVDNHDNLAEATFSDLSHVTLVAIMHDCDEWQKANAALLEEAYARGYDEEQAGHDYWLTRNGHGAGFWDRRELECQSEEFERFTDIMVDAYKSGDSALWDKTCALRSALKEQSLGERLTKACQNRSVDLYRGDDGKVYLA